MKPRAPASVRPGGRRSGKNFPPSTLLYIAGLVDVRAKVEIEVTAFVPGA